MNQKELEKNSQKANIFTKETLGVVLVLFATLCLVCLITRDKVFFLPGAYVNAFLLGMFGYFAYAVVLYFFILGVELIVSKKVALSIKSKLLITTAFILSAILSQIISIDASAIGYGEYLSLAYSLGADGITTSSAGGLVTSIVAYPIARLLSTIGASVIVGICIACVIGYLVYSVFSQKQIVKPEKFRSTVVENIENASPEIEALEERDYPIIGAVEYKKPAQKLFINDEQSFSFKSKKELAKGQTQLKVEAPKEGGLAIGRVEGSYTETYSGDMKKKIEYIKTPAKIDYESMIRETKYGTSISEPISPISTPRQEETIENKLLEQDSTVIPFIEHESKASETNETELRAEDFSQRYARGDESTPSVVPSNEGLYRPYIEDAKEQPNETEEIDEIVDVSQINEAQEIYSRMEEREIGELESKVEDEEIPQIIEKSEEPPQTNIPLRSRRSIFFDEPSEDVKKEESKEDGFISRASADGNGEFGRRRQIIEESIKEEPKKEKKPVPINRVYNRPPLDLLDKHEMPVDAPVEDHDERKAIIKKTLEEFHINAEPTDYIQGPTITRYELMMPPGISVKKVLNYDNDLKMRLSSQYGVRIEAPIPGKNAVGIEVANKTKVTVGIRELIEDTAYASQGNGKLIFAIGRDIVGKAITDNLAKGPHYLVAGATGSGKSVCLNVMIVSLLMRYSPEELRLILIDPKRVGFRIYNHLPHLMIDEIINEPKKALSVLAWTQVEMERRYKVFEDCPELIMDIDAYNERIAGPTVAKMPRIVVVIDELADLMETYKKDMETKIRAIAQKARAAGIHLVLATQRPSVDIITGTIKANLPSRIALKVMNFNDSQTILSEAGAEKLLGNGDMLYKNSSMPECERYQGAWISDREITNVVNYIKEHNESYFDDDLKSFLDKDASQSKEDTSADGGEEGDADGEVSELFIKALALVVSSGTAAISQLQRRFQIGYARAGGLIDKMERMGYISGNEGSKARRVLISREEFEQKFGPISDSY